MKFIKSVFAFIGGAFLSLLLLLGVAMIAIIVLIVQLIQSAPM